MSTPGIIATGTLDSWSGFFVHSDGYPHALGQHFWRWLRRGQPARLSTAEGTLKDVADRWNNYDSNYFRPAVNNTVGVVHGWIYVAEFTRIAPPGGLLHCFAYDGDPNHPETEHNKHVVSVPQQQVWRGVPSLSEPCWDLFETVRDFLHYDEPSPLLVPGRWEQLEAAWRLATDEDAIEAMIESWRSPCP